MERDEAEARHLTLKEMARLDLTGKLWLESAISPAQSTNIIRKN